MKHYPAIFFIFLACLYSLSCNNKSQNIITGKWKWHQVKLKIEADGSIDTTQKFSEGKHDGVFIFNDNGTGTAEYAHEDFHWFVTTDKKIMRFEWIKSGANASMKIVKYSYNAMLLVDTPYLKSYDGFVVGNVYYK